jgi:hypothetical protein
VKFELRDPFAVPPDVLFSSLIDPELDAKLAQMTQSTREHISETTEGDVIVRKVRYSSGNPAFANVAKLLGTDRVTYEQHLRIDMARMHVDWQMVHPAVGDRLKAEGSFCVVPHPEGSERVVEGVVEVRIPLIGGTMEGKVVEFIRKMYARGTQWRREYLARPKA